MMYKRRAPMFYRNKAKNVSKAGLGRKCYGDITHKEHTLPGTHERYKADLVGVDEDDGNMHIHYPADNVSVLVLIICTEVYCNASIDSSVCVIVCV
eukprot:1158705-Pelagomonas_calceolata.AAC.14